ncbi:acetyltransferase, GNAT family protein [Trichomonas vaginalis G3]|uniref:Acetyltransferase, GNAT family protein n=1 Tax=Trichomonas vaginalis (strain ATCC PRA-98 / G3) TaxID=412133 RepID=A2DUS6_TRIV3|nr:N-terminal peptidyl-glutamic acid acetylation [Trichomonas vaginalis G3]EAY15811.1 acetyltransferase, GNAT family protein [Trichomonas vaginalis G3]KAI5525018.1 N-terminal peptidyl-glutamic acid acetylation [Trichomonas vaginalis G3]|eukprot:XP_001328034.1 acetyltransferase, GNAT family protein [Trichomonas vaginalis G3]
MPISIRRVKVEDMIQMQQTNNHCLPENYQLWFWLYHYLLTPQASHVAINCKGQLVGYVLCKTDDEKKGIVGQVTSVSVYNGYRKLGLASTLLGDTHVQLQKCFNAKSVTLNVRETNRAGHILYMNRMGYKFEKSEKDYYADGEAGWLLRYTYPVDPEEEKAKAAKPIKWNKNQGRR